MVESIKVWLAPPDLQDEDQNRLAQYLHTILLAGITLLIVYLATRIAAGNIPFSISNQIIMGLIVFLVGLVYLLHRGYLQLASILMLVVVWLTFTLLAWRSGGVRDIALLTYILIILMTSLLLGWRAALVATVLCIAAAYFLVYTESIGLILYETESAADTARVLSLIFILIFILNRLLINTLSMALERIKQNNLALQAFSNDLENRVIERTRAAELARQQADAARREAETARLLIETQMWFTNGQAELNTQLRGEQDVRTLAQQIIGQLCRYLNVPLGAIFIREGSQFYLRGSYAYAAAQKQKSFQFGEGLAGEVAQTRQALLVDHVPPDYLHLPTSVGDIRPKQIFLHPLIYEEEVIGVVELATLGDWTARQSGFVNSVAESIAIAFHTAQTRGRIDELLMETQQQAEELQAQEEELRAANEEWEVQSESLRATVTRWQQEKAKLEATIAELRKQNALLSR